MSLTNLVQKTCQVKADHPKAAALDWHECAYLALREEFGVEPSEEEIAELAQAAKPVGEAAKDFPEEANSDVEPPRERQTGGGQRVVHKPEVFGG
jgi:hypothetical protein